MNTSNVERNMMTIGNTTVLRNENLDPLDDRQLRAFAPTIFAKGGIEGVSERYGFVSTKAIIDGMRDSGFECVEVRQSQRRGENVDERMKYTKHLCKFRPKGAIKQVTVGGTVMQIIMLNSHDRSSGFQLYPGLFRLICSNGMMVSESEVVSAIKVMHTARMVENIIDKSKQIIDMAGGVHKLRDAMTKIELSTKQQNEFAKAAIDFRPPRRAGLMLPETLLAVRRKEDDKPDLWHTFNRVQENMLRGGNETLTADGRKAMTRGIGRIERDVEFNTKLWSLAVQTIGKAALSAKRATTAAAKKAPSKKAEASTVLG